MNSHGSKQGGQSQATKSTSRDPAIPASEEGTGIVPEDQGGGDSDVHLPESERDSGLIEEDDKPPAQSWPGKGGPGTIPPPG